MPPSAPGASGAAQLLIVKAGSVSGAFTDATEAAAIHYAVDHGAKIVNLSVGGTGTSSTERAAVLYAIAHGVLIVAPVGNGYATSLMYPAALLGEALGQRLMENLFLVHDSPRRRTVFASTLPCEKGTD